MQSGPHDFILCDVNGKEIGIHAKLAVERSESGVLKGCILWPEYRMNLPFVAKGGSLERFREYLYFKRLLCEEITAGECISMIFIADFLMMADLKEKLCKHLLRLMSRVCVPVEDFNDVLMTVGNTLLDLGAIAHLA